MASEILITDIRMIGLETFIPWALFRMRRFDMKNSNDNFLFIWFQKYGKLLCMETIFVFLLVSCSQNAKGENRISGTIVIEEDTLRIPKVKINNHNQ